MMDHYYGKNVRVVCKPAAEPSCDLVVQYRKGTQEEWQEYSRHNDMSDDYAYTRAHAQGMRAKELLDGGKL